MRPTSSRRRSRSCFPETQVTIGPVIENGFYYDFLPGRAFLSPDDLVTIEARMHEIVKRNEDIRREVWDRVTRRWQFFRDQGELYKAEIIASIPEGEEVGLYRQGEFIDLCRGPHLPSTGKLGKSFKLMSLAGAYWRGDSNNEMLQRIYGTAWTNDKDLKDYLKRLEEAEKRDHRRLGREMDLFHIQEEGPGAIFWHPKGWTLFQRMIDYMREKAAARWLSGSEHAGNSRSLSLGAVGATRKSSARTCISLRRRTSGSMP